MNTQMSFSVESYLPMLMGLSDKDKETIIVSLSSSIGTNSPKVSRPDIRTCFSGHWEDGKGTDIVADELRTARWYDSDKTIEW